MARSARVMVDAETYIDTGLARGRREPIEIVARPVKIGDEYQGEGKWQL